MEIDEQQQQQEEGDDDLLVNFFPSTQFQSIRSVEGSINLLVMHQMAQERLPNANNALGYVVHLVNRYGNEGTRTLEYDREYVKSRGSKKMQDALNKTRKDGRERFFKLEKHLRTNTIAVIMFMPRDVAFFYYRFPEELFASLDYTITVYDGSDDILRTRILEYMVRVSDYNDALFSKLELILPVNQGDLDDPLMVLFVAISGDSVVGYCGCNILRYRIELRGLLDGVIRSLERRDIKLRERFFMSEPLSHLFEIKGLSVDQGMGGRNIALMLLYCAMDFMREPRIHEIYPVSHIATQAASYITKRLLVTNSTFHFAYHGVNEFMNESFFEALGQEKKTELMRVITEYIGYYRILVAKRAATLSSMLRKHNSLALIVSSPYSLVIRDAICIYQLYYLLLVTSERPRAYNCFSIETLEGVIDLFKLVMATFPSELEVYIPLRNYLERNIAALRIYRTSRKSETLYSVVHTKGLDAVDRTLIANYGFLTKQKKGKKKVIIMTAYEFIYASITNTVKLMQVLVTQYTKPVVIEIEDDDDDEGPKKIVADDEPETTNMKEYLTQMIGLTNKLIEEDLAKQIDYEIPRMLLRRTLNSIAKLVTALKKTVFNDVLGENPERSTIQEIFARVEQKILFVERNQDVCALITNGVFNIDPIRESTGFDTFISYNRLAQHWPVIESDVHQRVGYNTATNDNDDELAMVVEEVPTLEKPDSAEKRKELIDKLYQLLVYDPPKESEVLFGERVWSVAYLTKYFRELSVMEDVLETQKIDDDDVDDIVATPFAYLYDYDAFDRSIEVLENFSVFNNAFI